MHRRLIGRSRSSRNRYVSLPLAAFLVAVAIATYASRATHAAPEGAPEITSFVLVELSAGNWRATGSVTASEGLEGLVLYFGGLMNETEAPEPDGSFSVDFVAEPIDGDWAEVYAIDRWEMQSETEKAYF